MQAQQGGANLAGPSIFGFSATLGDGPDFGLFFFKIAYRFYRGNPLAACTED